MASASDDDQGYEYVPDLSTFGICYQDATSGDQRFFYLRSDPATSPRFHLPGVIPRPIICSSSIGLVVSRSCMSSYFVSNPFVEGNAIALPTSPSYHHPHSTSVVLAATISPILGAAPVFHVICATRSLYPAAYYRLDTYSSNLGVWISRGIFLLQGHDIVPNTGVSCCGVAYWLTEMQPWILRYDVVNNAMSLLSLPVSVPSPETRLQLGTVADTVGVVIVTEAMVVLYLLNDTREQWFWELFSFLNVELRPDADWDSVENSWERGNTIICREMPWPIRFESYKVEVLLWVDGRVIVWESNSHHVLRTRLQLTPWNAGVHVANGVAHVRSNLRPGECFGLF